MRTTTCELLRYTAASGAALALDVGLLALLASRVGIPYLPASAISFVAGGVLLYVLCIKHVFRFRRIRKPALELPLFIALGLVGLAVNTAVIYVVVDRFHGGYLQGKGVAAACTFSVNFLLRRLSMFSRFARPDRSLALAD